MVMRRRPVAADPSALQQTLDALTSPIRREILWMLWEAKLPAGEIAAAFDVSGGTVSTHLAALREAGLVVVRADGNFRRYRADRSAMASVLPLLTSTDERWQTADNLPERALADASVQQWVNVTTEVSLDQQHAFDSFARGDKYSEWLGVPVTIRDGRFAAELEWGTRVRGHYEVIAAPPADRNALGLRRRRSALPGASARRVPAVRAAPPGAPASRCTSVLPMRPRRSSSRLRGRWCSVACASMRSETHRRARARGAPSGQGRARGQPDDPTASSARRATERSDAAPSQSPGSRVSFHESTCSSAQRAQRSTAVSCSSARGSPSALMWRRSGNGVPSVASARDRGHPLLGLGHDRPQRARAAGRGRRRRRRTP